jgi:hypothetical protein
VISRRTLNAALARATGYKLRRVKSRGGGRQRREQADRTVPRARVVPAPGDRLVSAPTFIICTLRSGSTLLRVLMNSHSQLHAPHELHLRYVTVRLTSKWGRRAMNALGLDAQALKYLLWDRILHRQLAASGKPKIVCKTPNDVFIVDEIAECWPDARFIYLLRHPGAIVRSRQDYRAAADPDRNVALIRRYCDALESARRRHPGHTVRYEELTTDPAGVLQAICDFLDVPWEPEMLDYGRFEHGEYRIGLGDWKSAIRTGRVQPAKPPPGPEETPAALREIAETWGYLSDSEVTSEPSASARALEPR